MEKIFLNIFTLGMTALTLFMGSACTPSMSIWEARVALSPSVFAIQSEANLVQSDSYDLKWNAIPFALSYDVHITKDLACSDLLFERNGITDTHLNLDSLAEGQYHFCLYANIKGSSTLAAKNNGVLLTIDKTIPIVTAPDEVQTYTTPFAIKLAIQDISAVTVSWSQESGNGTVVFADKTSLTTTMSADRSGLYKVKGQFTDQAGNTVANSYQFYWDDLHVDPVTANPSPVIPIVPDPAQFISIQLAGVAADAEIDPADHLLSDLLVSNLVATGAFTTEFALVSSGSTCSGPLLYYPVIPKSDDARFTVTGFYKVCVRVQDELLQGFAYGSSAAFSYFSGLPTITSFVKTGVASDGFVNDSEKGNASPLWILNQTLGTIVRFSAPLDDTGGSLVCDASQTYPLAVIPLASALSGDGEWSLCAKIEDAVGHAAYGKADSLTRDTISPTLTSFLGANAASDAVINWSERNSVLSAWAILASGQVTTDYTLPLDDSSPITCNVAKTYDQSAIPLISAITTDGTWALCVRLVDIAGNITYGKSVPLIRNTHLPLVSANSLTTTDKTPPLSGAIDVLDAAVTVSINGSSYTATNNTNGTWSLADNTISTLPHGYYDITVTATDSSGNTSTATANQALIIYSAAFISTWKTDNVGSSGSNSITLPLEASGTYNFNVDWGDGVTETITAWNAAAVTHTYAVAGTKTVSITLPVGGSIRGWRFNNGGDRLKFLNISAWGPLRFGNNQRYFQGTENLTITATDRPNLSGTTDFYLAFASNKVLTTVPNMDKWDMSAATRLEGMFEYDTLFNQNISTWNVGSVTIFKNMFSGNETFNQPLGSWNMSSATNLESMFLDAKVFNQNIGAWDVHNVTTLSTMFQNADAFNQNLNAWNVSAVTNFSLVFRGADVFNQPLNNWNVSAATKMNEMFLDAVKFNQTLANWNVSSVTDMHAMFRGAILFNQDLNLWDVSHVQRFDTMFANAPIFNGAIGNWVVSAATRMDGMFIDAYAFNVDISTWNVSSVQNMSSMFQSATGFNQNITGWNVGQVTTMKSMFEFANAFNQNVGLWNVTSVTDMDGMFYGKTIPPATYEAILIGWSAQVLKPNVVFHAGNGSTYSSAPAVTAKANIISSRNWTIHDAVTP